MDHISPVIPVDKLIEQMTRVELVERMFCSIDNLQVLCEDICHRAKTAAENKVRVRAPRKPKQPKPCVSPPAKAV